MAKENMICPFSGRKCRDCALYRGRHYYLCFSDEYRGSLGQTGYRDAGRHRVGERPFQPLEVPALKVKSAIDPFTLPLKDIR